MNENTNSEGDPAAVDAAEHIHEHGRVAVNQPILRCRRCGPLLDRIAELEHQRDALLALCDEEDAGDWKEVHTHKIRAIYGGGE